jgi:hypothetical protein
MRAVAEGASGAPGFRPHYPQIACGEHEGTLPAFGGD